METPSQDLGFVGSQSMETPSHDLGFVGLMETMDTHKDVSISHFAPAAPLCALELSARAHASPRSPWGGPWGGVRNCALETAQKPKCVGDDCGSGWQMVKPLQFDTPPADARAHTRG